LTSQENLHCNLVWSIRCYESSVSSAFDRTWILPVTWMCIYSTFHKKVLLFICRRHSFSRTDQNTSQNHPTVKRLSIVSSQIFDFIQTMAL